jgi:hypothetical protein
MAKIFKSGLGKHKFIILSIICLFGGFGLGAVYLVNKDNVSKIEQLKFVEGQLDYSYSPWIFSYRYWGLKRRRLNRKRSLDLFLVDDLNRYTAGNKLLSNLYEEPFFKLTADYPRPNAKIGFIDTDDPYVKEVYSIQIDELDLVNLEGIKNDLKSESWVQLISSVFLLLLGSFFAFKFLASSKERS